MPLHFTNPVELRSMKEWDRAIAIALAKAQSATIHPTRKSNGNDISYPAIPNALSQVDIFGRAITNMPGIYPYGSATGTTPVTSTSLKAGTYKRAKIKGKGVTKRKQAALWGRYVPCDGITNGASTSIDTGVYAVDNIEICVRVKAIGGSFYLLQARQSSTATIYGLSGSQTNNTITSFGLTSGITRTTGHVYTIKLTMVNRAVTLYVKDETAGTEDTKTGTASATDYTFPSTTTIKLFGDASKVDSGVTVYRAYIKVNGQMAWDMYPAVDVNNSNAVVAYDDVTHAPSTKVSGSITGGSLIQPIASISGVTPSTDETTVRVGTSGYLLNTTTWTLTSASGTLGADIPYTELCPDILETNVGDALYGQYGKNLYDKVNRTRIIGYFASTGTTWSWASAAYSNKIPCKPNTTYTVRYNGNSTQAVLGFGSCSTDEEPTEDVHSVTVTQAIRQNSPTINTPITITTGPNDKWLIVAYNVAEPQHTDMADNLQIEEGSTATVYEPYHFGFHPSGEQKVFMGEQGVVDLGTLNWTKSESYNTVRFLTPTIADVQPAESNEHIGGIYLDGFTVYSTNSLISAVSDGVALSSAKQISIRINKYNDLSEAQFKAAMSGKYLFYQRTGDASFIPPQTRTITTFLPSATSFIDAQKASNNAECDWKFKVLDGTEDWDRNTTIAGLFHISLEGVLNNTGVCTYYEWGGTVAGNMGDKTFACVARAGASGISIRDTRFNTKEELNAFLASEYAKGTPVIIAYPLATPSVTTVTLSELTQPLGTVTILNEFADGTKGAVDFYGVNVQIDTPVPKPDEPYPLLSNAGEVSYGVGRNKFDEANIGYFPTSSSDYGAITFANGKLNYKHTPTISGGRNSIGSNSFYLDAGTYTVSYSGKGDLSVSLVRETSFGSHAGGTDVTVNAGTFTATERKSYHFGLNLIANKTYDEEFNIMLNEGPITYAYEPYKVGWHGDGQQTVKIEGANLWNLGDFLNGTGTQKTLEGLDPSKTYTILIKASSNYTTDSTAWSVSPRNADGSSRGNLFYMNNYVAGQTVSVEFAGAAMLRIQGTSFTGSFYICVVEGSATEYEPYITPQTVTTSEILPSATSKLNMQGGNDNKECDWAFKQLDGVTAGLKFNNVAPLSTFYFSSVTQAGMTQNMAVLCTHFKNQNVVANNVCYAGTGVITFHHSFDTLAEANAWLASEKAAGHPVILAFPVATHEVTTVATQRLEITAKKIDLTITSQFSDGASADLAVTYLGDPEPPPRAVKFTAEQANSTVSLAGATGTNYKYSTDGETFNVYTSGTTITLANIGDAVWFQGVHNENVTYSASTGRYSTFTMTGKIAAIGNIDWLLDPGFDDVNDTLPRYCYFEMFRNCTSLTSAPELPAQKLGDACYCRMFWGCTNLTSAPTLPAMILVDSCYMNMFYTCTSLISAPELPATALTHYCYRQMFSGCTSLNYVVLHATADSLSQDAFGDWLHTVAATGTLKCPASLVLESGASGLPSGWTRVNL